MTVGQAIDQLIEVEEKNGEGAYDPDTTLCVGMSRVGHPDQCVAVGTMRELRCVDFGAPLHSFIIAGATHFHEREHLACYLCPGSSLTPAMHSPDA